MLTLISVSLCIAVLASSAKARMAARCSERQTPSRELHCGKRNLWHANHVLKFLSQHPQAGLSPLAPGSRETRRALVARDGRWLRKYSLKHIAVAKARMVPAIPHRAGFLCIHSHEGSWTDSGDPYWGGLQMDRTFMLTYAPRWLLRRGWANVWTPDEQMMVAERAYSSGRGYGPWPVTARMCGLL